MKPIPLLIVLVIQFGCSESKDIQSSVDGGSDSYRTISIPENFPDPIPPCDDEIKTVELSDVYVDEDRNWFGERRCAVCSNMKNAWCLKSSPNTQEGKEVLCAREIDHCYIAATSSLDRICPDVMSPGQYLFVKQGPKIGNVSCGTCAGIYSPLPCTPRETDVICAPVEYCETWDLYIKQTSL